MSPHLFFLLRPTCQPQPHENILNIPLIHTIHLYYYLCIITFIIDNVTEDRAMCMTKEFADRINLLNEEPVIVPTIDAHCHFVDFLQNSKGFEELLPCMSLANIRKTVIFGMPVIKKWACYEPIEPTYYLSDNAKCYYYSATDEILAWNYLNKLTAEQQSQFAPMICGFNVTDMRAVDYLDYIYNKYPFWKGVGEIFTRHDDLTNLTEGDTSRGNMKSMMKVYKWCGDHHLPVLLHHNSTSVASSLDKTHQPPTYEYLDELSDAVTACPDTTFVWAHCGGSRRVTHDEYYQMVEVLIQYPNLYVDISWVVYDDIICKPRQNPTDPLIPKDEWVKNIFLPYPDKIMLGSDLVGNFSSLSKTMGRYNNLLKILPADHQNKIAWDTAQKIYFDKH